MPLSHDQKESISCKLLNRGLPTKKELYYNVHSGMTNIHSIGFLKGRKGENHVA
jgi:hypothetical protein